MNDNKTNTWVWIVVIILILLGAMWYFSSSAPSTPAPSSQNTVAESLPSPEAATPAPSESGTSSMVSTKTTTIVLYGPSGFSPSTVTIHQGDSVMFKDQTGNGMWVASNPHPTHQAYSGTTRDQHCPDTSGVAFDQCASGATYTFTFQKIGTWGYHDHGNPTDKGSVIVQ